MIKFSSPAFLFGVAMIPIILFGLSFVPSCKLMLLDVWRGPAYPYKPGDTLIIDVARFAPGSLLKQCPNFWEQPDISNERKLLLEIGYDDLIPPCDPSIPRHPPLESGLSPRTNYPINESILQPVQAFESKYESYFKLYSYDLMVPDTFKHSGSRYLESGYRAETQDFAAYYLAKYYTKPQNIMPQLHLVTQCSSVTHYILFHEGNKYTMPTDAALALGLPVDGPTWSDEEAAEIVRNILHKNATK